MLWSTHGRLRAGGAKEVVWDVEYISESFSRGLFDYGRYWLLGCEASSSGGYVFDHASHAGWDDYALRSDGHVILVHLATPARHSPKH